MASTAAILRLATVDGAAASSSESAPLVPHRPTSAHPSWGYLPPKQTQSSEAPLDDEAALSRSQSISCSCSDLSDDVLSLVFSFLAHPSDLYSIGRLSRRFAALSALDLSWEGAARHAIEEERVSPSAAGAAREDVALQIEQAVEARRWQLVARLLFGARRDQQMEDVTRLEEAASGLNLRLRTQMHAGEVQQLFDRAEALEAAGSRELIVDLERRLALLDADLTIAMREQYTHQGLMRSNSRELTKAVGSSNEHEVQRWSRQRETAAGGMMAKKAERSVVCSLIAAEWPDRHAAEFPSILRCCRTLSDLEAAISALDDDDGTSTSESCSVIRRQLRVLSSRRPLPWGQEFCEALLSLPGHLVIQRFCSA